MIIQQKLENACITVLNQGYKNIINGIFLILLAFNTRTGRGLRNHAVCFCTVRESDNERHSLDRRSHFRGKANSRHERDMFVHLPNQVKVSTQIGDFLLALGAAN